MSTEVIKHLTNRENKLSEILNKIKYIFNFDTTLFEKELRWIDNEINGYKNENEILEYRIFPHYAKYSISNAFYIKKGDIYNFENYLDKDKIQNFEYALDCIKNIKIRDSISVLENDNLGFSFAQNAEKVLQKHIGVYYKVDYVHSSVGQIEIKTILENVRINIIEIYENKIRQNQSLNQLAKELFMNEKSNITQNNTNSIVNNGSNSTISNIKININQRNDKDLEIELEFIEKLELVIKESKEIPDSTKSYQLRDLEDIKNTEGKEERITKWNAFRSMVADYVTINTLLHPFLLSLGA